MNYDSCKNMDECQGQCIEEVGGKTDTQESIVHDSFLRYSKIGTQAKSIWADKSEQTRYLKGIFFSQMWLKWSEFGQSESWYSELDRNFFLILFILCWSIAENGTSQVVLVVNSLLANAGDIRDVGLIPGSGRSPGGGHGNPPQYSWLENSMDRGVWWAIVQRVAKSQTQPKWLSRHTEQITMSW